MDFSFQTIEIILAIQKYNSISQAAQNLYVSEPALSKQIKRIENSLGYPLVIRTNSGCSLTPSGLLLAQKGIEILKMRDKLLNEMAEQAKMPDESDNRLRFGLASCYSETLLPKFLPQYLSEFPDVKVELLINKTDTLENMCADSKVDIILTQEEYCDPRLECVPITKEEVTIYLPKNYETIPELKSYFIKGSIPLKVLEPYPNAQGQGHTRFLSFIERYFNEVNFTPNTIFESESWSNILSLVADGMCYCIMPDIFDPAKDRVAKLRIESNFPTERTLAMAFKSRNNIPSHWFALIDIVKECLK